MAEQEIVSPVEFLPVLQISFIDLPLGEFDEILPLGMVYHPSQ